MIELQGVSKIYDGSTTAAVEEVSFSIDEGETFGLIGTSGCGKTTTLKMINRLVEPTSGRILWQGESIQKKPVEELRRNIGYVIQKVGLFPHYTIEQNISIVPRLLHWKDDRIKQRTRELLTLVGLDPEIYASRKPEALSGGQQQRVGLARALAGNPGMLLMDEPFGALDPITKEELRQQFRELLQQFKKTVILVTHDVFEAFDLCDRIGLMDNGALVQTGRPRDLLFQPEHDFVRSFFQGHRFQLEMMSISVGDVLDHPAVSLKAESTGSSDESFPGNEISDHASVLSALEGGRSLLYVKRASNDVTCIDKEQLFEGFQKVRAALGQRGGVQ